MEDVWTLVRCHRCEADDQDSLGQAAEMVLNGGRCARAEVCAGCRQIWFEAATGFRRRKRGVLSRWRGIYFHASDCPDGIAKEFADGEAHKTELHRNCANRVRILTIV